MREIKSDMDCADCLCRVCARNDCNDSTNSKVIHANCTCNCDIGSCIIETEDDCSDFLPDENEA